MSGRKEIKKKWRGEKVGGAKSRKEAGTAVITKTICKNKTLR